jgi:hypothetical protein
MWSGAIIAAENSWHTLVTASDSARFDTELGLSVEGNRGGLHAVCTKYRSIQISHYRSQFSHLIYWIDGSSVTLYTCILEALVSTLARDTANLTEVFRICVQSCKENFGKVPQLDHAPLCSKSISNDHSPAGWEGMENCCWSLPAHLFLFPNPPGLDHILLSHDSENHPIILLFDVIQGRLRRRNITHKNNKNIYHIFIFTNLYLVKKSVQKLNSFPFSCINFIIIKLFSPQLILW